MARPRIIIDPKVVEELAGIACTYPEIAAVVGCSEATLHRRFESIIKRGADNMHASLKRRQFEVAMAGNVGMLIWLGKIHLKQREQIEHTGSDGGDINIAVRYVNRPNVNGNDSGK